MSAIVGYNTNINGLSLYLDARNPNSYPGSGNTWYDLSLGANNVSTGSMKYVSAGLTSSFSSSYDTGSDTNTSFINFYAPNLTTVATVETICRFNNTNLNSNTQIIFGWDLYRVIFIPGNGFLSFQDALGGWGLTLPNSGSSIDGGGPAIFGIWYHFVFEMNNGATGPLSMFDNKMWVNGVQQNLTNGGSTQITASQTFDGGNGLISSYKNLIPYNYYNGINDYSMFKVYNRTLSQEEITNNYNYYKPLFNLY